MVDFHKVPEKLEIKMSADSRYKLYVNGKLIELGQHCQVFAILTDSVALEQGKENLLKTIQKKPEYTQCSVAMAYYLYRALEKCNLYEYTNEIWDLWRDMVKTILLPVSRIRSGREVIVMHGEHWLFMSCQR